jgi:hypothetical protein
MTAPQNPDSHPDLPARRKTGRTQWVPVEELSPLARALLSDDLGGRDVVPGHVADRVSAQATEWAAHGFTEQTVRPWQDLPPAAAAYLADRDVEPRVLDLPVEAFPGAAPVALRIAITAERIPVERAYELLVLTGEHRPKTWPTNDPPPRKQKLDKPRPIAPVLFSHTDDE